MGTLNGHHHHHHHHYNDHHHHNYNYNSHTIQLDQPNGWTPQNDQWWSFHSSILFLCHCLLILKINEKSKNIYATPTTTTTTYDARRQSVTKQSVQCCWGFFFVKLIKNSLRNSATTESSRGDFDLMISFPSLYFTHAPFGRTGYRLDYQRWVPRISNH